MLSFTLYVSSSTIDPADADAVVAEIVETAHRNNPALGLTGALLFTGTHFAQVLEGKEATVDAMIAKIRQDPRHTNFLVVDRSNIAQRQFRDWSMAYSGPSQFVSRHVTRLPNEPAPAERNRASEWLTELLGEFSRA